MREELMEKIKGGIEDTLTDDQKINIYELVKDKVPANCVSESYKYKNITFDLNKLNDDELIKLFDIVYEI